MVSVYSSTSGISSTHTVNRNDKAQNAAGTQLASGKKINKASDDAASLAIAAVMGADVSALKQSATNLVQGTSLLQTADGALEQAGSILDRMKSLATQANSGSLDPNSQAAINQEYQSLLGELNNLGATVKFNGQNLVDGSFNQNFQAGTDASSTVATDLTSVDLTASGLGLTAGTGASATALSSPAAAQATASELDTAINNLASNRATVGALQSQFSTRGDVLQTEIENTLAAQSAIADADIGEASKNMAGSKLLTDLSIAAAAQGNRLSSSVLQLVR